MFAKASQRREEKETNKARIVEIFIRRHVFVKVTSKL